MIIFLVILFVIIFILAIVFIWLYVMKNDELAECQRLNEEIEKKCKEKKPEISIVLGNVFATGTTANSNLTLQCPTGEVIGKIQTLTKKVDGCVNYPISLDQYVNATGKNSYLLNPSQLLEQVGIDYYQSADVNGLFPTQIVYGSYTCMR